MDRLRGRRRGSQGDVDAREFTAFWLRDGRVQAAMNVNQWDDGEALQLLVDARAELTPDQLRQRQEPLSGP
ncbi:hypothetical protein A6A25_05285 [Saccharothrix sp. CB00851]|nr:hypothetical protein A6A25_05285 [Saccharothrix sp. CB00851]